MLGVPLPENHICLRRYRFAVTYQTAGEKWDAKTRAPRNPLEAALRDVAKIYARKEEAMMCDVRVG